MDAGVLALITAGITLATAISAFFVKLRAEVQEIHVMVNSRMMEAQARIDQLDAALTLAGIAIPPRPIRTTEVPNE